MLSEGDAVGVPQYTYEELKALVEAHEADLVVFDPTAIGHGPVRTRDDLPGGASRLYAEATGIEHVLVNGAEVVRQGSFTTARQGRILRSGRDTDTVHAGAAALMA